MPTPTQGTSRQFDDVFNKVASGFATSSPSAIANGASGNVTLAIPDVSLDGKWVEIAVLTTAATLNVAGVSLSATVTGTGTAVVTITNNSGGSITPTASAQYTGVFGHLNDRFIK